MIEIYRVTLTTEWSNCQRRETLMMNTTISVGKCFWVFRIFSDQEFCRRSTDFAVIWLKSSFARLQGEEKKWIHKVHMRELNTGYLDVEWLRDVHFISSKLAFPWHCKETERESSINVKLNVTIICRGIRVKWFCHQRTFMKILRLMAVAHHLMPSGVCPDVGLLLLWP